MIDLFRRKPQRNDERPSFRFYPGAYEEGGPLKASNRTCDCCGKPCVWEYIGNIYGQGEAVVCAGCIAAGNLGTVFPKGYSLHDIELEQTVPDALSDELLGRTPGVACYNPFNWPVSGGAPMVFVGYGEALAKDPEAIAATQAAFNALGWDDAAAPSSYALLFRPLHGGAMRAVIDLD